MKMFDSVAYVHYSEIFSANYGIATYNIPYAIFVDTNIHIFALDSVKNQVAIVFIFA